MARVAALYDIHGNLPALEAVLAELPRHDVDSIVIGGDVVWGPLPAETLDALRSLDLEVHWVRGNGDREVADEDLEAAPDPGNLIARITHWVALQMTPEERALLGGLPVTVSLEIDGLGPVLFCHGTPRSDEEIVTSLTPEAVASEIVGGIEEHIVVFGHTHVQFDRRVGEVRLINAGSLGMPYEDEPGAYWTLLGPDVQPMRTTYDLGAAVARIRTGGAPDVESLISTLREPPDKRAAARQHETRAGR
jgi:predicted phosphodiesterase